MLENRKTINALRKKPSTHPYKTTLAISGTLLTAANTCILSSHNIRISMDDRGRWMDNVFIERLWKSVKYEEVYLKAYSSITEARRELTKYFDLYNKRRRHQGLDNMTPDEVVNGLFKVSHFRS